LVTSLLGLNGYVCFEMVVVSVEKYLLDGCNVFSAKGTLSVPSIDLTRALVTLAGVAARLNDTKLLDLGEANLALLMSATSG